MNDIKKTGDDTVVAFFTNDHHNFPDTNQSHWTQFASQVSQFIQDILEAAGTSISLIEVLQILALERAKFAQQQPGLAEEKKEKFGQWRESVYSLSSKEISKALQRRKELNELLKKAEKPLLSPEIQTSISHTLYEQKTHLFTGITQNLEVCEQEDNAHLLTIPKTDRFIRQGMNQIISERVNISPPSFFDVCEYKKQTIIDDDTETPLTSFFVLSKPAPTFFVVLEHPQPHIVFSLLTTKINKLFLSLLRNKENKNLFIEKLSEFLWYGHQLMPFERGSASIFLILTCSLLRYANLPLIQYPDNRLDIDAISLTKHLFSQKFISLYK